MAKIISFLSIKDGMGKTLLSSHLAYFLYLLGYRVILWDFDFCYQEITRKFFGAKAVLKHWKFPFDTPLQFLQNSISEQFPITELILPVLTTQDFSKQKVWPILAQNIKEDDIKKNPALYLIPSYYREPPYFWQKKQPSNFSSEKFSFILDNIKNTIDIIILDTISSKLLEYNEIIKFFDLSLFITNSNPNIINITNEYIEYLNCLSYGISRQIKIPHLIFQNMVNSEKNSLCLCPNLNNFNQSQQSRCQFYWQCFYDLESYSSICWTRQFFQLARAILLSFQADVPDWKI